MPNDPQPANHIADDDPEVVRVMKGLRKAIYPVAEIIANGPHGRTTVYEHVNAHLLSTFVSNGRRFAYAIDFARYLVALKRIGEAEGRLHHLAKRSNRPAHDPNSQRAA